MSNRRSWPDAVERYVHDGAGEQGLSDAAEGDPRRTAEVAALDGLARLIDDAPFDDDAAREDERRLVEAALARMDAGEPDVRGPEVEADDAPDEGSTKRRLSIVVVAATAAALLLAWGWSSLSGLRSQAEEQVTAEHPVLLALAVGEVYLDDQPAGVATVRVPEGGRLRTADGEACVDAGSTPNSRARVCMQPESRATFTASEDGGLVVRLEVGRVVVDARGLAVRVEHEDQGFTSDHGRWSNVAIDGAFDGQVRAGEVERLESGTSAALLRAPAGSIEGDSAELRRRDDALLERLPLGDSTGERAVGWLAIDSTPDVAEVSVDGRTLGPTPTVVALSPGEHRLELQAPGYVAVHQRVSVQTGITTDQSFALSREASSDPPDEVEVETPGDDDVAADVEPEQRSGPTKASGPAPRPTAAELLVLARQQRGVGKIEAAARTYERLRREHPRAPETKAALVSLGQLYLRLERPRAAARMFKAYLGAGGGALAEDARYGLIMVERRRGNAKAEQAAIEAYLRAHPHSARASKLRAAAAPAE